MKKFIALCLVLIMCMGLVACGGDDGPQGTYKDGVGFSKIVFSGDKVELYTLNSKTPTKGTFTMDGDKVNVKYSNGNTDSFIYNEEEDTLDWNGTGLMIYKKAK